MLRVLVDLSYGYPLQLEDEKRMLKLLETASMLQVLDRLNTAYCESFQILWCIDLLLSINSFLKFRPCVCNSYSIL